MENIELNFDPENFPELIKRYSAGELRDLLCRICQKLKM